MKDGDRGQWENKTEYILVVAGNVVGLGNVWRFPYLCYKNGGGAFLVPYGLLAVVCGIPLFLLEIFSGQYTQEGFITCWRKLCPLAQGIGCGHTVSRLYDFSYIIIEVWALFYLVFSFKSQLPWTNCENTWNSVNCISLHKLDSSSPNVTENQTMSTNTTSAATEFWERRVLAMSGGIQELGSVRWELALCLLFCWVVSYFSIWKGVRSSGKVLWKHVAYFTATFPYVMLLILLVRGLTLPGAWDGIRFYLNPDLSRLADIEISFILYLVGYTHLKVDHYTYPDWAYALGWIMTLSSVLMVPLWAAGQMCLTPGTFTQRLHVLCRPAEDPAWQRKETQEEGMTVELRTRQFPPAGDKEIFTCYLAVAGNRSLRGCATTRPQVRILLLALEN
ncbi:hypothetical protein INR49_009324 [Caranx melampygus]|nr:hypothetical protein INR49_009324 [Caranx melampygus]